MGQMRERYKSGNPDEMIISCCSCGASDLYLQKDFPRKIAIATVIAGVITVPITLGISLLIVALIDFILYRRVSWMAVCYRCRSEYRKFKRNPVHKEFDRHLEELYRY